MYCPTCAVPNFADARFCSSCGRSLKARRIALFVLVLFGGLLILGLVGLIGVAIRNPNPKPNRQPDVALVNAHVNAAPTETPNLTDTQKVQRAKGLITDSANSMHLDEAFQLLKTIPKTAKEYKEGEKLITSLGRIVLEREVIGQRPITGSAEVKEYLRNVLNDYDSSEFIEWSSVEKVYLKKGTLLASGTKAPRKKRFRCLHCKRRSVLHSERASCKGARTLGRSTDMQLEIASVGRSYRGRTGYHFNSPPVSRSR